MNSLVIRVSPEVKKDLDNLRLKLLSEWGVESISMSNIIKYLLPKEGL
jgi:hypothetical protein